jgi:hypothetical protein
VGGISQNIMPTCQVIILWQMLASRLASIWSLVRLQCWEPWLRWTGCQGLRTITKHVHNHQFA